MGWGGVAAGKAGLLRGCSAARIVWLAAGQSPGSRCPKEGAKRMPPGARSELLGHGPRTYLCAPWGGSTGRVHGTGRRRASVCARFRAPLSTGQRRRARTLRKPGTRRGAEPENGGGYAELSLRPFGAHANAESQYTEAGRQAATGEFRTALRTDREGTPAPRKGARPRRAKNAQLVPPRVPSAVWATTARAGIKGEGGGVVFSGRTNGIGSTAWRRSSESGS